MIKAMIKKVLYGGLGVMIGSAILLSNSIECNANEEALIKELSRAEITLEVSESKCI